MGESLKPEASGNDDLPDVGGPYDLLESATPEFDDILDQIKDHREIAANTALPKEIRIEAFENIYDSEVGDTSLVRARNVERETGLRQIYLKFEGGNPTGTQKDRIAFSQVMDAMRRGFDAITLATCGNYGAAMAFAASIAGLRCVIFIPEGYKVRRFVELDKLGAEVRRVPGDYENAVVVSRQAAKNEDLYDGNPGGANTTLQLQAYGEIAYEIYDELRDAPSCVAVPVSNGTTLAGIYRGFLSLYRRGKVSKIPRFVASSSYSKNPIVQAFLKGLDHCEDLLPARIKESAVNEPLINWHSADGEYALKAVRQSKGWAANITDNDMKKFSRALRNTEGLHVLPASTAGLIALIEKHRQNPLPSDRYVAVLTGRKE